MPGGWVLPGSRAKKEVEKDDMTSHCRTLYRGTLQEESWLLFHMPMALSWIFWT